ncbi:MAG: hypothetical protein H0U58_00770 [Chloroflexi bacterium]|nr:hypothetical protein [Chloroflexota bacterium]
MARITSITARSAGSPTLARGSPSSEGIAAMALFALAVVVFLLDATATIQAMAIQPGLVEQNPLAGWTLSLHPAAPYGLKLAVAGGCAAVIVLLRTMNARWAGYLVTALMAAVGMSGIASAVSALAAASAASALAASSALAAGSRLAVSPI